MTSQVNSVYDLVAALVQAELDGILAPNRQWRSMNTHQQSFVHYIRHLREFVPALTKDGLLKGKSTWKLAEINKWFADNKFDIRLSAQPTGGAQVFYVGGIYSHLMTWFTPGKEERFQAKNGKSYEGARLKNGAMFYSYQDLPIVAIPTKDRKDMAYMMPYDLGNTSVPFQLLSTVADVMQYKKENWDITDVIFPMVDLDMQTDVSWLKDMWTPTGMGSQTAHVIEAKQQSRLKINHLGAQAESAAGMSVMMKGMSISGPMVVDRPFLFWIVREGISVPMFAAWVDFESWKNPGKFM